MTRRTPPFALTACVASALALVSLGLAPAAAKTPDAKPAAPAGIADKHPAAGEGAPSVEDIKNSMEEKNYREALQKLSRALSLKGPSAGQYDKHELLVLKAESQLNLKDVSGSAASFAAAAKEAKDDTARAQDKASEQVVKRSKNLAFTPKAAKKGEKPDAIDISDPEKRKEAFKALLEEEKAEAAPTLKAAKGAKTLPPIVEALKRIGDLRSLELAATGEDTEATKLSGDLSDQAFKLMDKAVQDMAALVKDVEAAATEMVPIAIPARGVNGTGPLMYQSYKRRGLMTRDTQDLNRTISDLKKLVPMARDLSQSLGDAGKQFAKVADDGEAVGNQAYKILHTDYSNDTAMNSRSRGNVGTTGNVPNMPRMTVGK